MNKLNAQIRPSGNTSIYIVITSKVTGLNSYLLQSSLIAMTDVSLFFTNKEYYNKLQSTLKAKISIV